MVLNEIVRGAAGIGVAAEGEGRTHSVTLDALKEAVTSVMEEYTSLRNWHLMTVSEETEGDRQDLQVSTNFFFFLFFFQLIRRFRPEIP